MTTATLTLGYSNTFEDFRQAQRGHLAARGGAGLRWAVLALAIVLGSGVGALLVAGPVRPAGPLGPWVDLARGLLLPFAPWVLLMTYLVGLAIVRQRPPRERVIDVVGQTRPRWFKPESVTIWTLVVLVGLTLVGQGWMNTAADRPGLERWLNFLLPIAPYGVAMLFLWWFVWRRVMRKAYAAQQSKLERAVTTTITAERVTVDDVLTTLSYRWPAFARCVETADLFLLYTTEVSFFIVPKRAFASTGDVDGFRQLVGAWAESRSAGFPVVPVPVLATTG